MAFPLRVSSLQPLSDADGKCVCAGIPRAVCQSRAVKRPVGDHVSTQQVACRPAGQLRAAITAGGASAGQQTPRPSH